MKRQLLTAILLLVGLSTMALAATNPNRVTIKGKNYYLNGINVAWDKWDGDLTQYDSTKFESMFTELESIGANSIRWWWFIDGLGQLTFSGNNVQPLDQAIFTNLDQAFRQAARHHILIMPSLLSFDIKNSGKTSLVTDTVATNAFINNVVKPLVLRYEDSPAMGIWEIMNEGEWLLTTEGGTVAMADFQRFHGKVAAAIHATKPNALVTTGSGMYKYMITGGNKFSDAALKAAAGNDPLAKFDVYQTHYYSWMHGTGWTYEPWAKTSTEWLPEGKPILIGEFPILGEVGRWTGMDMHVKSVDKGYAGSFGWAYFDNRADKVGYWVDAKPCMQAISTLIPAAMIGETTTPILNSIKPLRASGSPATVFFSNGQLLVKSTSGKSMNLQGNLAQP
jgi:hypothetical protein